MTDISAAARITGPAAIAAAAFRGDDTGTLFETLAGRIARDPTDAAALYDMALLLDSRGEAQAAARLRREALTLRRDFAVRHGDGSGPRLLALVADGGFMANTPVDFLLEGSNAVLWLCHVDGCGDHPMALPPHDAAILAVGESPANQPLLARLPQLLATLPRPARNGVPDRIAALRRDRVATRLGDIPGLICPATVALSRDDLSAVAQGERALHSLHPDLRFPLVLRPDGSHAGRGMERVQDAAQLVDILADCGTNRFVLSNFIDYRGPLGLFAKVRVVMIAGRPWPVHLALSEDWIVHYLSAGMAADPARRAAEAEWFATFHDGFARRHGPALAAMQERLGLDYWGFDGAETADGGLLLFEADTALIVHDMDDATTFPYKRPAMQALFGAFRDMAFARDENAPDEAAQGPMAMRPAPRVPPPPPPPAV